MVDNKIRAYRASQPTNILLSFETYEALESYLGDITKNIEATKAAIVWSVYEDNI